MISLIILVLLALGIIAVSFLVIFFIEFLVIILGITLAGLGLLWIMENFDHVLKWIGL